MKKLFTLLFFFFLIFSFSQEINDNILIHYKFNGNYIDDSQNDNNGTNYGTIFVEDRFGNPESAVYFDGENDYIEFPNISTLKPDLPVSFSFWVKYDVIEGNFNYILNTSHEEGVSSGVYFNTEKETGKFSVNYGDGTHFFNSVTRRTYVSNKLTDSENWHHILAVVEGPTNMKIYIDCREYGGEFSGSGGELQYSTTPGEIGKVDRDTTIPTSFFKGILDDFRYWDRVVNETEINQLCTNVEMNTEDLIYSDLKIFPNPTEEILNIQTNSNFKSFAIFDISGKRNLFGVLKEPKINVSTLEKGIYILQLYGTEATQTTQFIKK